MNRREFLGFYHRQPSRIDGSPIILVITGFSGSENAKTGSVLQSWILREDISPWWGIKSGADYSVCRTCRHRPFLRDPKNGIPGDCYVHKKPLFSIYNSFLKGRYLPIELGNPYYMDYFTGRILRMGSYGEPPAIDLSVWQSIIHDGKCRGWLGYTHLWNLPIADGFQKYCQASVDSLEEMQKANSMGWFTFRVGNGNPVFGESRCPASAEMGHRTTCSICRICDGNRGNRLIQPHGFRTNHCSKGRKDK